MTGTARNLLTSEINAWLAEASKHQDALEDAQATLHNANRRLTVACEALDDTTAELYAQGAIIGRNVEERDACARRLTAAERYEVKEAQAAVDAARARLDAAERDRSRDRDWRTSLELRVALAVEKPTSEILTGVAR
jgi:chromosome segregation ATPase